VNKWQRLMIDWSSANCQLNWDVRTTTAHETRPTVTLSATENYNGPWLVFISVLLRVGG